MESKQKLFKGTEIPHGLTKHKKGGRKNIYKVGLEMTYYFPQTFDGFDNPKLNVDFYEYVTDRLSYFKDCEYEPESYATRFAIKLVQDMLKTPCVYDQGCVEISTPTFTNLKQLERFYTKADTYCKSLGLVPHSDTEWGGMCHINMNNTTKDSEKFVIFFKNLYADILNRPYLNWIFNAAGEDVNACSYLHENEYFNTSTWHKIYMDECYSFDYNMKTIITGNKGAAFNVNYDEDLLNTYFEYRFIDMYSNWEEFKPVLIFIYEYQKHIERLSKKRIIIPHRFTQESQLKTAFPTSKKSISAFKNLLKELGLDYKDYAFYIERNLKVRYDVYPDSLF